MPQDSSMPNSTVPPMKAWRFADAPAEYRELVPEGPKDHYDAVVLIPRELVGSGDLPDFLAFLVIPSNRPGNAMWGPRIYDGWPSVYMTYDLPNGDRLAFIWDDRRET